MFTNPSKPFNINLNAQHVNETTHFDLAFSSNLVRLLDALEYVDKYEEIQEWQATPM